jgi:hypothetical protein
MAYGAYYMPSLAYGNPATTLSYKVCEDTSSVPCFPLSSQKWALSAILQEQFSSGQQNTMA